MSGIWFVTGGWMSVCAATSTRSYLFSCATRSFWSCAYLGLCVAYPIKGIVWLDQSLFRYASLAMLDEP